MARNRSIADVVARITPAVERPTDKALETHPDGFLIEFRGGDTARVLPGRLGAALLDILDDLRRERLPAYVETEADGAITSLRIPLIVKVEEVREEVGGDLEVLLFPSHARHTLSRKNEEFSTLLEVLLGRRDGDDWLLVTETDRHEIIDVRPFRPDDIPLPEEPSWLNRLKVLAWDVWIHRLVRWWMYRLCHWFCCWWPFRCVSVRTAWDMFNLVAPTSCSPLNPQAPCIPFLYPDNGCWARAHEMCRLMIAAGVHPAKVWIDGRLRAATRNRTDCEVRWSWHVAPTLCVRTRWCRRTTYVIDPSLFTGPVTEQTWKSVQGDPGATLTHTSASVYLRPAATDPGYVQTNQHLATYRIALKNRSTLEINPGTGMPWGPPPYAHCP
jgi:Glutaminase